MWRAWGGFKNSMKQMPPFGDGSCPLEEPQPQPECVGSLHYFLAVYVEWS